jgi:hypothetical protein
VVHISHILGREFEPGLGRQHHVLDLRRQVALEAAQRLGARRRVVEAELDFVPVVALGRVDEDRVEPLPGVEALVAADVRIGIPVGQQFSSMSPSPPSRHPWRRPPCGPGRLDSISVEGPSTQSPPA